MAYLFLLTPYLPQTPRSQIEWHPVENQEAKGQTAQGKPESQQETDIEEAEGVPGVKVALKTLGGRHSIPNCP